MTGDTERIFKGRCEEIFRKWSLLQSPFEFDNSWSFFDLLMACYIQGLRDSVQVLDTRVDLSPLDTFDDGERQGATHD